MFSILNVEVVIDIIYLCIYSISNIFSSCTFEGYVIKASSYKFKTIMISPSLFWSYRQWLYLHLVIEVSQSVCSSFQMISPNVAVSLHLFNYICNIMILLISIFTLLFIFHNGATKWENIVFRDWVQFTAGALAYVCTATFKAVEMSTMADYSGNLLGSWLRILGDLCPKPNFIFKFSIYVL
jgi:hypothetical protein